MSSTQWESSSLDKDAQDNFADVDRRLALAFGGLILLLMLVALLAGGWYLRGVTEREENRLSTLLTEVLSNSVSRISFSGKYHARLLLEEIQAAQPMIRYLRIIDTHGIVLAASDATLHDQRLDAASLKVVELVLKREQETSNDPTSNDPTSNKPTSNKPTQHWVRHVVLQGEPIREVSLSYRGGYDDAVQGVIQVGISEKEQRQALLTGFHFMIVLVIVLLFIGIVAIRRISAHFGRPVRQLANDLAATLHAVPDLLFELDQHGRYLKVLTHHDGLLIKSSKELFGRSVTEVLPPAAATTILAALNEAADGGDSHGHQIMLPLAAGNAWFELSVARKLVPVGSDMHFIVLSRDISERMRAQAELLLSASVFDNSREGILVTDPEQRILRANPAFCRLTGYAEFEIRGKTPKIFQSGHQNPEFYRQLHECLAGNGQWQGEVLDRRKDGEVVPILLSISMVRDETGRLLHYVAVHTDISQIKQSEARLEYQARHDPLTGLSNRLMLHLRTEHALARARRENQVAALLMLDLDRFKDVNDSFGHLMGDALLREVAQRLTQRVRNADTVSRLGGDEFTVLLEHIESPDEAAHVAQSLIEVLSEPFHLPNGSEIVVGATIGIALFPEHGDSEDALLQGADAALYQAKAEGRGCYRFFSDALTQAARERIVMETRLRRALAQEELRVYFQPQVDIASGEIVGAEALVRWLCPDEGLIPPGRFIPIAEQTGLIEGIGRWVLLQTCRIGRRWQDDGLPPLTLAVNVSARQIMYGDLVATVAEVLQETGFPAQRLELEMTESALMEDQNHVLNVLGRLRTLGVRIAIDDFGTGYSSLAYLKRFPIDVLKIDKSFVDDIPRISDDMEITATIIAMAHTLRLKVLAEGVETQAQLDFLIAQGCDFYQGYLKSRPIPAEEFVALIKPR
jgi:diguanylate cyclase (GGDEF)-like protein/PAS domain S-box-containing protein